MERGSSRHTSLVYQDTVVGAAEERIVYRIDQDSEIKGSM